MSNLIEDTDFIGKGWAFPPSFDKYHQNAKMVSGQTDIEQSLQILFSTYPGERVMIPDYGSRLIEYLFEEIDSTLISIIQDRINRAILYYEPRIIVNDIIITANDAGNPVDFRDGILKIQLDYTIRSTNSRNNRVFPYYLSEANLLIRPEIL